MVQQAMREAAPPAPANIPAPAAPTPEAPVESPAEIAARRSARMAHAAQIAMAHAAAKSAQQNAPAAAPPAPIRSLDDYDWDAMLAAFRSTGDSTPLKEAVAACGKNPMGLEAAFARAAQRIADALPKEPPADTMRGSVDPSDLFGDSSEEEEEAAAVESAESPGLEPASAPRTPFPHGSAAAAAPAGADVGRWIVSRPAPEACVDPAQYSPEELRAARLAPPVRRLAIDTDPYLPLPAELERQVQRARTLRFFPTRDPGARDAELAELRRLFIRYDLTPKEADRTMNHLLEWSKAAGVAEILARQYPDGVYYAEPFRRLPTMLCRHCEDTGILGREGEEHSCACAAGWELTRRWRPAWDREGNSPQRRAWRNDGLQPPVQTNGKERMPAGSEERSMPGESKERLC